MILPYSCLSALSFSGIWESSPPATQMRYLLVYALILGLTVIRARADAVIAPAPVAAAANEGSPSFPDNSAPASAPNSPTQAQENTVDLICRSIEAAASKNGLPLEFLTRLIWQESRFDSHAISHAGAQGIAQFMPKTAEWVGLSDPFDTSNAIDKSAALLQALRQQFGNLGLAAAAYNAGPKRVSDWLAHKRGLPLETLAYVHVVTGHDASEWSTSAINSSLPTENLELAKAVPCPEIVKLFAEHHGTIAIRSSSSSALAPTSPAVANTTQPPWGVQLIGGPSQMAALAAFYQMQRTYRGVLSSHTPMIIRTAVGTSGSWYRVRVGAANRGDAERLCSNLRAVGGSCLVQAN